MSMELHSTVLQADGSGSFIVTSRASVVDKGATLELVKICIETHMKDLT